MRIDSKTKFGVKHTFISRGQGVEKTASFQGGDESNPLQDYFFKSSAILRILAMISS